MASFCVLWGPEGGEFLWPQGVFVSSGGSGGPPGVLWGTLSFLSGVIDRSGFDEFEKNGI